jgi:hypothetical protein
MYDELLADAPSRGNATTAATEMWRPTMSTAREALRAAAAAGIQVAVDGKDLVWQASREPPAALLEALARHKPEIIALLSSAAGAAPSTEEDNAERAAVIEFNGGIRRLWAEALAKLCKQRRPDDVPPRQWNLVRSDFAHFCDRWTSPAEALGWRPRDLLGWDVSCPYSPIARRIGLAWKFDGATVVEVRPDGIMIERQPGFHTLVPRWTH